MLYTPHDIAILSVERAISDLKRGVPVIITDADTHSHYLVLATETALSKELEWCRQHAPESFMLVLSRTRSRHLFPDRRLEESAVLPAKEYSLEELHSLACEYPAPDPELLKPLTLFPANPIQQAGLVLAKLAELLPSILTIALPEMVNTASLTPILTLQRKDILHYQEHISFRMEPVSSTPLHLQHINHSSIIAFRPSVGDKEHYAIMVGTPDPAAPPLVRVHSSCYTGDLLASLRCDCRDQLHLALQQINQAKEGGIVIYLLQEGRGIGLANKLRTYALQEQKVDTVDANEILGFDDDERLFLPAAVMLKQLGYRSIQLLTNNPRKVKEVERYGITVTNTVPLIIEPQAYNQGYLETKASRLGHVLNITNN